MKILRITDLGYETGGVESGIVLLQKLLEKKGHTVRTLAVNTRLDLPHFNQYSYKPISGFEFLFHIFNPYSNFALKKVLKEYQPDVVNIHTIGQASSSIFFPLRKIPTVLTIHGPEEFSKELLLWCLPEASFKEKNRSIKSLSFAGKLRYAYHMLLINTLYRSGLRNVNKIVTLSKYMHELMNKEGLKNVHIPNGTRLLKYSELDTIVKTRTLLYVGRLEKFKGVDILLKAMPKILERMPQTQLLIAGAGSYMKELIELTSQLQLSKNVTFLGYIAHEGIEDLYKQAAVVVVPSVYPEAFGKIGIEAMSVGRVVVASDIGGISEWLQHNKTGLLVEPGNVEALEKAILTVLSDNGRLKQMGRDSRVQAELYDINKHADNIENIYRSVIGEAK